MTCRNLYILPTFTISYESRIEKKNHIWVQADVTIFRLKLLLAYQESNWAAVKDIPAPDVSHFEGACFNPNIERDFYNGLLYISNGAPEKGYDLFNYWMGIFTEKRPIWALNRFAAKLEMAEKEPVAETKMRWYYEAVKEWNTFEGSLPEGTSLDYIQEKVLVNKLEAWNGARLDLDFDKEYMELEKVVQLRPQFLAIRIRNFVRRHMQVQALALLGEAEEYHQLADGNVPPFIAELRKVAYNETSEEYLRERYKLIFLADPESLVKIVPRNVNAYDTLPLFLLSELCKAGNDMLSNINSISSVRLEDKYSDLLALSLGGRLINYGWRVGPARGGFSESQKRNPGEIDFSIYARTEKMSICEAMILSGKGTAIQQSHSFKIFNYSHNRDFFYMIVYYTGKEFDRDWTSYRTNCSSVIKFPSAFKLKEQWQDLSDFENHSIKVGRTVHGAGTQLYHLFININYLLPKKGRAEKKKDKPKVIKKRNVVAKKKKAVRKA